MCKKVIYLISFVLALALAGNASADPSLVAHYKLDGDVCDTGNVLPATNGALYGNPRWTTGRVGLGGSIDFDGVGDYVKIPNAAKLNITDNLTVAFWLRVDNFGSDWQRIVVKGTGGYDDQDWKFERNATTGKILWNVMGGAPWNTWGNISVNDGEWHHLAGTYNRTTGEQILYVDGAYDNSSSGPPHAIQTSDRDVHISPITGTGYIDGGVDDLRIYNRVLSAEEIATLGYNIPYLQAHDPDPCTGQVGVLEAAILSWKKGDYAASHNVYLGTNFNDVNNATTSTPGIFKGNQALDANSYDPTLELGKTYYWRIDEVNDACSPGLWRGWVWSFAVASYYPTNPSPADKDQYAALDANLTWTAGVTANKHRVYFGTASSPPSVGTVYMPVTTWNPPDFIKGQKYNWKIIALDEVNTPYVGPIWSFRATTGLRGWWKFDDLVGNTPADSSGNNNRAVFGVSPNSMPAWTTDGRVNGALVFDGDEDWVEVKHDPNFDITKSITLAFWIKIDNFGRTNQRIIGKFNNWKLERNYDESLTDPPETPYVHWTVEGGPPWNNWGDIAVDDGEWHHIAGVYDGTTGIQTLYVDGVEDSVASGPPHAIPTSTNPLYIGRWPEIPKSEMQDSNGLACVIDDVRVYDYNLTATEIGALANIPWLKAHNAKPANKSTAARNLDGLITLSWTAATEATSHNVYFGTDFNDVNNATTSTPVIYRGNQPVGDVDYVAGPLEAKTTYYWRIDELGAPGGPYKGDIWRFTTAEYIFVDNFEDYNNTSNRIQDTWIKGGGGNVGYSDPNYAEVTIVRGGKQSMPFDYNNVGDSSATRTFTSWQDWTAEGVKSLELWFRGWPAGVGSFTGTDPYTITASGTDIGNVPDLRGTGYQDEFHYAYKKITGDPDWVTIIARVDSVSNTDPWAKAGVMIRKSLDPNSKNGFMCITPGNGAAWQYRNTTGGLTTTDPCRPDVNAPYWVKLDIFPVDPGYLNAYCSADGTDWHPFLAGPALGALPIYVGLAVTSHNAAATGTAEFSDVSITAPGMTISSWSNQDIGIKSNVAAPLYVTLQDDASVGGDTATLTHTDTDIVLDDTWQAWDIALNDFKVNNPSLNLEKIKKITLGVGPATPNGTGTLYFDDIMLYPPRCMPNLEPDLTGDCFIDFEDLYIMTGDWLESEYIVTAVTPSNANLVARYEFENNLVDSFGGHNGAPGGDPTYAAGKVGDWAVELDGDDYVVITDSNQPGSAFDINGPITVACWIKVTEFNKNWQAIVTKGDNSWRLARASSGTGVGVEFACSGLSPYQWVSGDIDVDDGQWHHVAGTYDGSQLRIYVDGILDFFENTSGSINNSIHNVLIGANEQNTGREWNGLIDEVRIYGRALSHGEIVSLAGMSQVTQPLPRPKIDLYEDGKVNLKDYAVLGDSWLEEVLWP